MSQACFAVGIDLGTTHCVVAYQPLDGSESTQLFPIPQVIAQGQVEAKNALPSFVYLPHDATEQGALPWGSAPLVLGEYARELAVKSPNRVISSAKSWLCHGGVDRRSELLPLDAAEGCSKRSPYEVTRLLLEHLKSAWDSAFSDAPLSEQQLTITVPASFDPSARELTTAAARECGLGQFTLLEEPQAALYSWVEGNQANWREQVNVGDTILVVDIGGGTTDLSLISVSEEEGNLQLSRIAVGDHLLLGGDNMDLALANLVRQKLSQQGTRLQPWQFLALSHGCRQAKEQLFSNSELQSAPIVVPGRGSSLIGGTLRTELTRDEITAVLVEGFLPHCSVNDLPISRMRAALTTLSLPYAQDAAITRHLAAFLSRQGGEEGFAAPSAILFNGGVVKAAPLTQRLTEVVNGWLSEAGKPAVKILSGNHPDNAVAKGAASYSLVQCGKGIRIRGGTAASYYVGIESALPVVPGMEAPIEAYCIAPFGLEEGSEAILPTQEFGLVVGQPVRFRFFSSTVRHDDLPGTVLDFWDEGELNELPAIEAHLDSAGRAIGSVIPVFLQANVNELGTLELNALPVEGDEIWNVSFDTRGEAA